MSFFRCTKCNRFGYAGVPCVECGGITALVADITYAPIFVSKTQVLEWRKEWMADHPAADGEDHVTPFDALLYQHVPYDQRTQRLRGVISNIKWSEVPLAKLEGIAAVLCEYGDIMRQADAIKARVERDCSCQHYEGRDCRKCFPQVTP